MNDLPPRVQEIADVIGRHEALLLIGQLPKCRSGKNANVVILYVPKRITHKHRLVEILGWDKAQQLVKAFGGEILYPPNCARIATRFRNKRIIEMMGEGFTADYVAEEFGVTVRYVRLLRKSGA